MVKSLDLKGRLQWDYCTPSNLTCRNYGHICTAVILSVFHGKQIIQGADSQAPEGCSQDLESRNTCPGEALPLRLAKFILILPHFWN